MEVGDFPGKGSVLGHRAEETDEEEGKDAAGTESLTRCPGTGGAGASACHISSRSHNGLWDMGNVTL